MNLNRKFILSISLLIVLMGGFFSYQYLEVTRKTIHSMERERAVLLNRMAETTDSAQAEGLQDAERYHRQILDDIAEMSSTALILMAVIAAVVIFAVALLTDYFTKKQLRPAIRTLKKSDEGDIQARVPAGGGYEGDELAAAVNRTLSRLEQLQTELKKRRIDQVTHMEKMATIGEVAATVAHEIKNPLAGISGALQVLSEEYAEGSPRREIAGDILKEIDRLDRSIKDLLFFARPPEVHLIMTDIHAIIDKVNFALRSSAEGLGVIIRTEYGSLPEVQVDPDQISKALLNIGTYSIQTMRKGGVLTIATRCLPGTKEAEIVFSDTGGAVDEETLEHVFNPSVSFRNPGAGFGLAISRNIIESHRGRVLAEKVADIGTRFRIILPGMR